VRVSDSHHRAGLRPRWAYPRRGSRRPRRRGADRRLTARDLGLAIGRELAIDVGGSRGTLTIVGLLQPADAASARALEDLLVADIAAAEDLFGAPGQLSRIDLMVEAPRCRRASARRCPPVPTSCPPAPRPVAPRA
jgi:hypothetical protein